MSYVVTNEDEERYWKLVEKSARILGEEDVSYLSAFRREFDSYDDDLKFSTMHEHPMYLAADLACIVSIPDSYFEQFDMDSEDDTALKAQEQSSDTSGIEIWVERLGGLPVALVVVLGISISIYAGDWVFLSTVVSIYALMSIQRK